MADEKKWTQPLKYNDISGEVETLGGEVVARIHSVTYAAGHGDALGNLLAAAPEMYRALELVVWYFRFPEIEDLADVSVALEDAMKKARGE